MDTLILFVLVGVLILIVISLFVYLSLCIVIVKQGTRKIVERFGVYRKTLKEGIHIIWRPFDHIAPVPWDALSISERDAANRRIALSNKNNDVDRYYQLRDAMLAKAIENDINKKLCSAYSEETSEYGVSLIDSNVVVQNNVGQSLQDVIECIMFAEDRAKTLERKYRQIGITPTPEIIEKVTQHDAVGNSVNYWPRHQDPNYAHHTKFPQAENEKLDYVDLRERYIDSELCPEYSSQEVITKDNALIGVNTIVFFYVTDCFMYYYGGDNPERAMALLTLSTLRNTIASLTLEEALQSRVEMNKTLRSALDNATNAWGIKVSRVEIKEFILDDSLKRAMNTMLISERQKRATILIAEGDARSIELKRTAEAEGFKKLAESGLGENAIRVRECEALEKVADGKATKIFLPNNLSNNVVNANILADAFKEKEQPEETKPEVIQPEVIEPAKE